MNDALGNEILIGNCYGYATNKNGLSHVIIGIAKLCKKRVTLNVILKRSALYDNELKLDDIIELKTVTVRSGMLFPVQKENINI